MCMHFIPCVLYYDNCYHVLHVQVVWTLAQIFYSYSDFVIVK